MRASHPGRARVWRAGAALLLLVAGCGRETAEPAPPDAGVAPAGATQTRPYSVQLHVHGSYSEGIGSIASHGAEARDLGVDVIWWSDHGFRIAGYRRVSHFGFEAAVESADRDESWHPKGRNWSKAVFPLETRNAVPGGQSFVAQPVHGGERSLRLSADHAGEDWQGFHTEFRCERRLHMRSLNGDLTLEIWLWPESSGPDTRVTIEIELSEHPAPGEGFERHRLRYVVGDPERRRGVEREAGWLTLAVPVEARAGGWNRLALPLTRDAEAGFGELAGRDNALQNVILGVEARRGAAAAAHFDDLQIVERVRGDDAFRGQRELLDDFESLDPRPVQHQGVEFSWAGPHLNEFSLAPALLDYDRFFSDLEDRPLGDPLLRERVSRRIVEAVHARGGLVSLNHMFGGQPPAAHASFSREALVERLLQADVYGVDLLEVGYRDRGGADLEDHLWVWDELARRGRPLIGIGVSDSHGGERGRWRTGVNNFVSWIYATSPARADLLDGLREGRVYFGDPARFAGRIDLLDAAGEPAMGRHLRTRRTREQVEVVVEGLVPGAQVRVIEAERPQAARWIARGTRLRERHALDVPAAGATFVRVAVVDPDGAVTALSNPVYFERVAQP